MSPSGPKNILYLKSQCHYNMKAFRFGFELAVCFVFSGRPQCEWACSCRGSCLLSQEIRPPTNTLITGQWAFVLQDVDVPSGWLLCMFGVGAAINIVLIIIPKRGVLRCTC